jgi:hypothetical protein
VRDTAQLRLLNSRYFTISIEALSFNFSGIFAVEFS